MKLREFRQFFSCLLLIFDNAIEKTTKSLSLPPIKTCLILIINLQSNICPNLCLHQNKCILMQSKPSKFILLFVFNNREEARFRKFYQILEGEAYKRHNADGSPLYPTRNPANTTHACITNDQK